MMAYTFAHSKHNEYIFLDDTIFWICDTQLAWVVNIMSGMVSIRLSGIS